MSCVRRFYWPSAAISKEKDISQETLVLKGREMGLLAAFCPLCSRYDAC